MKALRGRYIFILFFFSFWVYIFSVIPFKRDHICWSFRFVSSLIQKCNDRSNKIITSTCPYSNWPTQPFLASSHIPSLLYYIFTLKIYIFLSFFLIFFFNFFLCHSSAVMSHLFHLRHYFDFLFFFSNFI